MINEKISAFKNKLLGKKSVYWFLCLGLLGILLIAFSGNSAKKDEQTAAYGEVFTNEQYCMQTEDKIKSIVTALTGDKNPSVVVTLDTGIKYIYADEIKTDTSDNQDITGDATKTQKSDSTENTHVIIKDSNGGQQALKVTEYMPTIRGVTVVCAGGGSQDVSEQIKSAVMTALDITSKRVFVTGK